MTRVRAMLFDAGNTLLRMDYGAIARYLASLGHVVAPAAVERAEWHARVQLDAGLGPAVSTESRATADRYSALMLAGLGIADPSVAERVAAWRRTYNPPLGLWGGIEPDAAPALEAARAGGVRTAVVSNSNGTVREMLRAVGLLHLVDVVIDSFEVGVEKPDPRIFRIALDRLGVAPQDAAYVGDLYSVDVLGARAAGVAAILLDPGGCWGRRDCATAPTVLEAVRLALAGPLAPPPGPRPGRTTVTRAG